MDIGELKELQAPCHAGFTLDHEIDVHRGEILVDAGDSIISVSRQIRAHVFWLGESSLRTGDRLTLKINSQSVEAVLARVHKSLHSSTLEERLNASEIHRLEAADCEWTLSSEIVHDWPIAALRHIVLCL